MRATAIVLLCSAFIACHDRRQEEDPYVTSFRAIRQSVALITVDGDTTTEYGTGSVVRSDARGTLVLTGDHVVEHAKQIDVQIGARRLGRAVVVAHDRAHDVALIRVAARHIPIVVLGDSSRLEVGQQIGIAGYPIPDAFAEQHIGVGVSLYAGRVAGIRSRLIEVDAPVIPGDSGGPVFDPLTGKVVAISEARFDDEHAIGIALPIDAIKPFIERNVDR